MTRNDLFRNADRPFDSDLAKMNDRAAALLMCEHIESLTASLRSFCRERTAKGETWGDAAADCGSITASISDVKSSIREVAA